jgi:hypothetical protein
MAGKYHVCQRMPSDTQQLSIAVSPHRVLRVLLSKIHNPQRDVRLTRDLVCQEAHNFLLKINSFCLNKDKWLLVRLPV